MARSGGISDDDNVPGLVDSPPDSDDEGYILLSAGRIKKVPGKFPWRSETACSQSNFTIHASRWMKLNAEMQNSAFGAVKRLLVTPFLFQRLVFPEKWIRWAMQKDMIIFNVGTKELPRGKLSRNHYLVVKMFESSLRKLKTLIDKKKTVSGIMKMMYSIRNVPMMEIDRVVKETRTNENVKTLVQFMKNDIKYYSQNDRDFFEADRMALTALMCLRQFAEVIHIIACEGRNIGIEVRNHLTDRYYYLYEDHKVGREKGNKLYKSGCYEGAVEAYTEAIDKAPFHYLLYSNRCQAFIRMSNYESAFTDAYRTVVLNPEWGKGYYKVVLCLNELGQLDEALDWGKLGLTKCTDEVTMKSLKDLMEHTTSKRMLEKGNSVQSNPKPPDIPQNVPEASGSKKKSKSKRKKKAKVKKEDEDISVPELISDDEFEECPVIVDKTKKDEETERRKEEQRKKDEKERKSREEKEEKEREILGEYEKHLEKGASEFLKSHYADACKSYNFSISVMETHKQIRGYTENDFATLLYTRGISSQRQGTATEIDSSRQYFHRIINEHKMFSHLGMAYYGNAKSTYLLNNFDQAMKEVSTALQMVKKFPIHGVLTWPGSIENIPESDESYLRKEIHVLLQQCKVPPIPSAVCRYEVCSKDYSRKLIYITDLNFEGYFEVCCDWSCILNFHLRCWSKFKHDNLQVSGDKDVLGMSCITPDCQGKIVLIRMLDELALEKKNLRVAPEHKKKEIKFKPTKYEGRMPKSEKNLMKFKEALAEKKRKREQPTAGDNESSTAQASKNGQQKLTEAKYMSDNRDLSEATIYVKNDNSQKTVGDKTPGRGNRRVVPASLQLYCSSLPGYKKEMSMQLISQAIERAKKNGTRPVLPDDLQEEIEQFALSLSEDEPVLFTYDEKIKTPFLLEYFVNFFTEKGPLDTSSELFTNELILMPEDMRIIIGKCGGLVAFLNSSPIFIQVPPYIGIHSHHQNMKRLTEHPRQNPHDMTSQNSPVDIDTLLDLEKFGFSRFAKDFYQIGANVEDCDIMNLTMAQAADATSNYSHGEMYKLDSFPDPKKSKSSQNSETSSMYSLDVDDFHEARSELSSQASFDAERCAAAGGRPPSDLKPQPQPKKLQPKKRLATTATQTEGKDEAEKAKEAVARLQERLLEMQDDSTKLKRTSQMKEEALVKDLEAAAERERVAIHEKEIMKQTAETEMAKIPQYKKQVQVAESKLEQIRVKEAELQMHLASLTTGMQQERETHLQEILNLRRKVENTDKEVDANRRRAVIAEIDLMRTKEAYHVAAHMQAKTHCEQGVREFDIELVRLSSILPEHVMKHFKLARKQWADSVVSCGKTIETLKAAYSSIIDQIGAGRVLSDLPSVPDLKPPPPGPNPRHMMIQLQRSGALNPGHHQHDSGSGDGQAVTRINGTNSPLTIGSTPHPKQVNSSPLPAVSKAREPAPLTNAVPPQPPIGSELPKAPRRNNFTQLVDKLSKNLPQLTRKQVEGCAQRVRAENKGLTGLLYEEIEKRIREMVGLGAGEPSENIPGPSIPPSSKGSIWKIGPSFLSSREGRDFWEIEDEAVCPICCDPLKDGRVSTLECEHKFHYECINKWMQKQRTCPNCRKFMADTTEFPSLGRRVPPGLLRNHNQN